MIAALHELTEEALIQILVEPKNALIKQYQRLMEMEGVRLKFTDDSLRAIAKKAITRKLGARGLRSILEDTMLDMMFDIPSQHDVKEIVISDDTISRGETPLLVFEHKAETA